MAQAYFSLVQPELVMSGGEILSHVTWVVQQPRHGCDATVTETIRSFACSTESQHPELSLRKQRFEFTKEPGFWFYHKLRPIVS